jgi:UDP-N-acetylglucosamine 2-epimerase
VVGRHLTGHAQRALIDPLDYLPLVHLMKRATWC